MKPALLPLLLAALVSIAFGVRYSFARQFMGYQAVLTGKTWAELERGTQIAVLGMLKVCGAGFFAYSAALLWFALPLDRGETWAAWAALSVTAALTLPVLYVTLWLRRMEPKAKTPVFAPIVVLLLVLLSTGASLA